MLLCFIGYQRNIYSAAIIEVTHVLTDAVPSARAV